MGVLAGGGSVAVAVAVNNRCIGATICIGQRLSAGFFSRREKILNTITFQHKNGFLFGNNYRMILN